MSFDPPSCCASQSRFLVLEQYDVWAYLRLGARHGKVLRKGRLAATQSLNLRRLPPGPQTINSPREV